MKFKTIGQGFGAAMVVLILRVWPQLSRYHPIVYHSFLPMRTVIWGILIDLAALTVLAALLFRYLEKSETGFRTAVWAFVAAELSEALLTAFTAMRRAPVAHLSPNTVYLAVLLGSLLLRWLRPLAYRRAVRGFAVMLLLGGCSLVWMLPELLYQGIRAQQVDVSVPFRKPDVVTRSNNPAGSRGRIVWLLFDELSYDQTFDHRFPGLAMPAFDQFKRQSVVFTDVKPAGYYTERVIPSLFLGLTVNGVRSGLDGAPLLLMAGSDQWKAFDARATLFSDAQRLRWTTGVVGWYNPYCRILAGTLDYCFWRMGDGQSDGALPDRSVWQNALAPLSEMVRGLKHEPGFAQQKHAQDLAVIMPQAEALIRDQNIGFVFIHLPVPHPPGVYDRRHQRATGSYVDSLELADQSLGTLLSTLSGTALAARTTVIVCSDHSWRVPMWRSTAYWTKEDERASGRRFDPRPVLMIHFPQQQSGHDVNAVFDEIRIHEIIERMLRGQQPETDKALLAGEQP